MSALTATEQEHVTRLTAILRMRNPGHVSPALPIIQQVDNVIRLQFYQCGCVNLIRPVAQDAFFMCTVCSKLSRRYVSRL